MKPGQKVICVDNSPGKQDGCTLLVKGKVYIIEDVNQVGALLLFGMDKIHQDWATNKGLKYYMPYWDNKRFKPIYLYDVSAEILKKFKPTEELADVIIKEPISNKID